MICIFYGKDHRICYGRLQGHHVIAKQEIKRRYRTLNYMGTMLDRSLTETLADPRNLISICTCHHELVTNVRIYITSKELPDGIDAFAEELGLGWYLARYYPHRGA